MGTFFVYILKTSLCLALFYLFYRLLLSKETFHRFNRIALLGVLVLSCLIPFAKVTIQEAPEVGQVFLSLEEMMVSVQEPEAVLEETSARFPWIALLMLVYVSGILFFLGRHLWSLARMLRLLRFARKEQLQGGVTLFVHREKVAPFSWMRMIAVSEDDLAENGQAILTHERAHIHNRHSWDLLLAEVCAFFQWFNPAAWLLKQELQTIHEYEADEWVIENGIDAKTYQLLIIKKAVGARLYSIANSFNHSSLKKRITMMIKKKSNPWARLKYLYVLPLAAVAVAAFARPEVSNKLDEISNTKINDLVSVSETFVQENDDSLSKVQWYEAVPVTEADTVNRLALKLEAGKKPLFVIDGQIFGTYLSLDDIDAAMVASATLLDKTEAMKLYGEKAKDGAIVIASKKPELTKVERVSFNQEGFKVSGQVMEYPSKKPVPGASILIKGTTTGTLADGEGRFQLVVKREDTLVVSYVGLKTQFVPMRNAAGNLVVWMSDDVQPMEEMTVVGYASDGEGTPDGKGRKVEAVVGIPEVKIKEVKVDETEQSTSEAIFQVVEEAPEFPGGMQACMVFLAKNIQYPVEAQKAGTEGRVIVQFVVGRDGSIRNPKVVRGVSPELDAEAIRVVSMMPKWNPGKQRGKAVAVNFTLPIMFRLSTPQPKKEETASLLQINLKVDKDVPSENVAMVKDVLRESYREMIMEFPQGVNKSVEKLPSGGVRYHSDHRITMRVENGKSPLIIVDGKEMDKGLDIMKEIPVNQIETVSLMKDKDAIAKYGEKAKDGAIEIKTKKNKK